MDRRALHSKIRRAGTFDSKLLWISQTKLYTSFPVVRLDISNMIAKRHHVCSMSKDYEAKGFTFTGNGKFCCNIVFFVLICFLMPVVQLNLRVKLALKVRKEQMFLCINSSKKASYRIKIAGSKPYLNNLVTRFNVISSLASRDALRSTDSISSASKPCS